VVLHPALARYSSRWTTESRDPDELLTKPTPVTCSQLVELRVRKTLFPFKLSIKTTTERRRNKNKKL
jgi:hypothetical protein